jgi:opacity protein-like surface antigen
MKTIWAVAFLMGTGSAWAQTADVWFVAGESLISSSLGADPEYCVVATGLTAPTSAQCQAAGDTGNDIKLGNGFRFGFRFGFNMKDHFGHEIQYAYSRTSLSCNDVGSNVCYLYDSPTAIKQGMAIHEGGYNFLAYATKEGSRIRPFGTAGVEFANYVPPGQSAAYGGGSTKFGFNYGAGVKIKVKGFWGIRFDFRQYTTPKPFGFPLNGGWVHQEEVTAGFGVFI